MEECRNKLREIRLQVTCYASLSLRLLKYFPVIYFDKLSNCLLFASSQKALNKGLLYSSASLVPLKTVRSHFIKTFLLRLKKKLFFPFDFFWTNDLTLILLYYVHAKSSFKSATLWLFRHCVTCAYVQFLVQSLTTVEENLDS